MLERLKEIERRYSELSDLLDNPELIKDRDRYTQSSKEQSGLGEYVVPYRRLKEVNEEIKAHELMLEDPDPEMRDLVREGLNVLKEEKALLENTLRMLFIPKDPNDSRNVILELRAGTGGEEAALFAADLFRRIDFPARISFVKLASYQGTSSSGSIKELIGWNEDIKNKTIRFIGDPQKRIEEDFLRLIRCIRFAIKLNFTETEIPGLLILLIDGIKEGKDTEDLFEEFKKKRKI